MNKNLGVVAAVLFVATVWTANWAVKKYGPVPVGFGLEAPAGVYFVGLAFTLRDVVHRNLGRWAVAAAILAGSALFYLISDGVTFPGGHVPLAAASAIAFLLSETLDFGVYSVLERRGFIRAVAASNVAGLLLDSLVFLWLAFGSLAYFWGQAIGKAWITAAAILLLALGRSVFRRNPRPPGSLREAIELDLYEPTEISLDD